MNKERICKECGNEMDWELTAYCAPSLSEDGKGIANGIYICRICEPIEPINILDMTNRSVSYDDLKLMLHLVDKAGYCSDILRERYDMSKKNEGILDKYLGGGRHV